MDQIDPSDEETLEPGKFPISIEPDVLYCYDEDCDDSPPLESLNMKYKTNY
jgi:hypothetical protein